LRGKRTGDNNAFAQYGILMHKILEQYEREELPLVMLASAYEGSYDDCVCKAFPYGMGGKYYQDGLNYLRNFTGFGDQYKVVSVEEEFHTELDGHKITGIIDLILLDQETEEYVIMDHKSKSTTTLRGSYKDSILQLYLYSHYVNDKYGKFPARLVFNCFRESEMVGEPFNEKEYQRMKDWVNKTIYEIETATEWPDKIKHDADVRRAKGKKPLKNNDFFCLRLCDCYDLCDLWHHELKNDDVPDDCELQDNNNEDIELNWINPDPVNEEIDTDWMSDDEEVDTSWLDCK